MTPYIRYATDTADVGSIARHLNQVESDFIPPLSSRLDVTDYAIKLESQARLCEAWVGGELVGLVAGYCNDETARTAFVTNVSVVRHWLRHGIAEQLLRRFFGLSRKAGMRAIRLEVSRQQNSAVSLYRKLGFAKCSAQGDKELMEMELNEGNMSSTRDYNVEISDVDGHKYAYNFDLDVMHPYMLRAFKPFFNGDAALELGSFRGEFTKRLLEHFNEITCVEASDAAIADARGILGEKVSYVNSLFEVVDLPERYDNIILTHVLEHLDDPVGVLRRVNEEWLSDTGRLLLVCPNANAPSRQIAVKMGLISHNTAITPAEQAHGHRNTYTLDTLERDVVMSGLKVVHRSGIFFKALANFQWDRLLQTDIISPEYLEGCYKLGQVYPDLCASIFLVCERGDSR